MVRLRIVWGDVGQEAVERERIGDPKELVPVMGAWAAEVAQRPDRGRLGTRVVAEPVELRDGQWVLVSGCGIAMERVRRD